MIDLISITDEDMFFYNTDVKRAENLLKTQLGYLIYAPDFGVDLRYFISEQFQFQNESFRSYLIRRMSETQIDVATVVTVVNNLFEQYTFNLADPRQSDSALVR
jgi:hypothetical protein